MRSLAFVLVSIPAGILALRLLRLWKRSGGAPELWLGVFFASLALSIPARVLVLFSDLLPPGLQTAGGVVGHVGFAVATAALFPFTQAVFRPGVAWARGVLLLGIGCILASTVWVLADPSHHSELHPAVLAANASRGLAFVWPFVECLRYWRRMRRRVPLGLADPAIADRFFLWSIWTGVLSSFAGLTLVARVWALATGSPVTGDPELARWLVPILVVVGCTALAMAAIAVWLSFFPPRTYLARLQSRQVAGP